LGHATAYTFAALVAVIILRRRLGGLEGRRLAPALGQIVLAGALTGAASWLVSRGVAAALGTEALGAQLLQVGAAIFIGLGVFLAITVALRLPELRLIRETVLGRWGGR
jgi:putative peptidoglycan lipid II flippase